MIWKPQYFLVIMAVLYVLNIVFGWVYEIYPNTDIPMHIIGGFLAASLGISLWVRAVERYEIKGAPWWVVAVGIFGFTCLIAVFWEFYEFIHDWVRRGSREFIVSQASVSDTVKDLLDGLIGAALSVGLFRNALEGEKAKRRKMV